MRFAPSSVVAVGLAQLASAQSSVADSLKTAIAPITEVSIFNSLLLGMPDLLTQVLDGKEEGVTLFIPTDDAITTYLTENNIQDPMAIPPSDLKVVLQYHVLDTNLKSSDFEGPRGITVPTRLRESLYNNRTAGPSITNKFGATATGNVVHIERDPIKTGKFRVRQLSGAIASLRGGLAQTAELTMVDGKWGAEDKNSFQIVNRVLVPPAPCSKTIRSTSDKLQALGNALNRTSLWTALDTSPNVTCLAPNSNAFASASNADATLDVQSLSSALLFHTLPSVTYTDYLADGMEFKSLANLTVRVRIDRNGDIFFNNAKVIGPNVITNNGLIHILDSVMTPLAQTETSPSPTGGPEPTESPDAAPGLSGSRAGLGLAAAFAAVLAVF